MFQNTIITEKPLSFKTSSDQIGSTTVGQNNSAQMARSSRSDMYVASLKWNIESTICELFTLFLASLEQDHIIKHKHFDKHGVWFGVL